MTNQCNEPIVQGAGHIALLNSKCDEEITRCALYQDDEGNLYCTSDLVPINDFMKIFGASEYIYI